MAGAAPAPMAGVGGFIPRAPDNDAADDRPAAPLDPYSDSAPPAPLDPYAAQSPPVAPTEIDAAPELPQIATVQHHTLHRAELDRRINDFDGLLATVQVAPARGGGFTLTRLDPHSWLATLGMRQGDQIRTIAGEPVSTVEDAARVYARIRSVPSFLVEIDRGTERVVLQYDVK
jgi:hypothetical protein